jgi:hypothetical protein
LLVLINIPSVLLRSPRVRTITFIPYTCCIYSKGFGQYGTSLCYARSSAPHKPLYAVLVYQAGILPPTSLRFLLTKDSIAFG